MAEMTEEQRKRAEDSRLAVIASRNHLRHQQQQQYNHHQWQLSKCPRLDSNLSDRSRGGLLRESSTLLAEKFRVRLEICSPDSFSITPVAMRGFEFPGEKECFQRLSDILAEVIPTHYTQNHGGGKACVYKLEDYRSVLACLKRSKSVEVEQIPWITFTVVEKLSHSFTSGRWEPCVPEHFSDEKVEELIGKLPRKLLDALLPFQLCGLRFGLQRGGRCLIADEMGLGKTLQAIAIAGCFMDEGPILVVCPAVLRFSWAEELERWLPSCLPCDIHLVFGHQNNPAYLTRWPKVVVISYTMLHHLRKSMLEREWALLLVDESHHLRCSKKESEPGEVKAVLDVAGKVKHIVLLSGTPSLSRPGLLGKDKNEFAKTYCDVKYARTPQGKFFKDFSKGVRLEELNVLLKQTVMIRRLKQHVLTQLPPKRRQIVTILLKRSDVALAMTAANEANRDASGQNAAKRDITVDSDEPEKAASERTSVDDNTSNTSKCVTSRDTGAEDLDEPDADRDNQMRGKLSYQERGIAKLSGFREWLSLHPLVAGSDYPAELDGNTSPSKMVIFAHHHKVLDGIQEFICEKGLGFVRIDGKTLPRDRQMAVLSFKSSSEVRIAIIGIEAGGVGLDFSAAQNVVFLELPQTPSLMLQAEDRAHRRGQKNAVNVYIFCAKDTMDESHWKNLNKRLHRVSSTMNGKYDAICEIEVADVCYLQAREESCENEVFQKEDHGGWDEELLELQDSCFVRDKQPCGVDEPNGNCEDAHESDLDIKIDTMPDLEISKAHPSIEQVEVFETDSEARSSRVVSSATEHERTEEKNQPEDVNASSAHVVNTGHVDQMNTDLHSPLLTSLRFEVSQYTGRIHLYSCTPGKDLRPKPLFENFRPEEIELRNPSPASDKETASKSLKDDPVYVHALLAFIKEWNELRPIEKRKLLGKPLQLPLSIELSYLSENVSHNNEGLLRGGSKRRKTPLSEISFPLPPSAVWKKVYLRSGFNKKEKEYTQAWTLSNEPLCKLCQQPCKGKCAKDPEYFEDLFCNLDCFEEYRIRTSSSYLRQELFKIEHGICTNCQLDCHQLVMRIRRLSLENRRNYIVKVAPKLAARKTLLDNLVNEPSEGNAWHADHIIPVYRGGGECRLENMRTLCVACHADVTAAQRAERRAISAKARKQLKNTLKQLKNVQNAKDYVSNVKDKECTEAVYSFNEDELLVAVPGSAYSRNQETTLD